MRRKIDPESRMTDEEFVDEALAILDDNDLNAALHTLDSGADLPAEGNK